MKAWELTRDLLRDTKPVVRTAEEQTWDASAVMKAQDDLMAMFWKSNVPGSAAPECLMAGALQSLENKGFVLAPYEELLRDGLAALERGDFETLYRIDMRLRVLMRAARPDPDHPSQKTVRYGSWDEFDAAVQWPDDVLYAIQSDDFRDRTAAAWMAQLVGAAAGTALEGYTAENIAEVFGPIRDYVREPNTYNDDITFEIAFLEAFGDKGSAVTSADIAERWTSLIPLGWSAEAIALSNMRRGLTAPETGTSDNPFDEWIGAQMRGTICGMVVPGRAREAARLAWMDAEISHAGNGILGEVFNAVMARAPLLLPTRANCSFRRQHFSRSRPNMVRFWPSRSTPAAPPAAGRMHGRNAMRNMPNITGFTSIRMQPRRSSRSGSAKATSTLRSKSSAASAMTSTAMPRRFSA